LAVKVAVALAALVTLGPTPSFAQDGAQPRPLQSPTFRSASALVALNVTVQDRAARFVVGLQPADFVVYEDGIKQDVRFFESTRVPVDIIVLLDTSASMRAKLATVRAAASAFLKTLRPEDRGAVVGFADSITVLQPLTAEQAQLRAAINATEAKGSTCLNNAVYVALKQFGQAARPDGAVRRQAIVVLSDGADTASLVSFDDVLGLARRMGVSIYTVSLQSPLDPRQQAIMSGSEEADYAMKALAKETGAQSFFPVPSALKTVYASIAAELSSQYSIGYVPVNTQSDGTFHRVNVQVVTRRDLQSRTRLGYTAGAATAAPLPAARTIGGGER
jgi:Ca-activated chloride channel family protein